MQEKKESVAGGVFKGLFLFFIVLPIAITILFAGCSAMIVGLGAH